MNYLSTRGHADRKRFCEILLEGLAPDGGLYLPEHYPQIDDATLMRWRQVYHEQGYGDLAFEILSLYIDDIPAADLKAICQKTYTADVFGTGEIVPCGFKPSLSALLADYVAAIIAYWLRDESEAFGNTTQMVDLSLGILVLALQSGLVDKLLALGGFMVRSQLARLMQDGSGLMDVLALARRATSRKVEANKA